MYSIFHRYATTIDGERSRKRGALCTPYRGYVGNGRGSWPLQLASSSFESLPLVLCIARHRPSPAGLQLPARRPGGLRRICHAGIACRSPPSGCANLEARWYLTFFFREWHPSRFSVQRQVSNDGNIDGWVRASNWNRKRLDSERKIFQRNSDREAYAQCQAVRYKSRSWPIALSANERSLQVILNCAVQRYNEENRKLIQTKKTCAIVHRAQISNFQILKTDLCLGGSRGFQRSRIDCCLATGREKNGRGTWE